MRKNLAVMAFLILSAASIAFSRPVIGVKYRTLSVDMAQPGCAISVIDYYGGHLESRMKKTAGYWVDTPPIRSTLGRFGVNFECQVGKDFDDAARTYGASWDADRKIWKPYYKGDDEKILAPVSRIYQLESKNATGFLVTADQINGEENLRVRFYSFCLFHGEVAVCGGGQSMRLERQKEDYLPFILRVLRGVSFNDDRNDGGN